LTDVSMRGVTANGFTSAQFYSTRSYAGRLQTSLDLSDNDLAEWSFENLKLQDSKFDQATLTSASFKAADLKNASFVGAQASNSDFEGAILNTANLSGANLVDANLTGADLSNATLQGADFRGVRLSGAKMNGVVSRGFTFEQLSQTVNYAERDLKGTQWRENDLHEWDFSGFDLSASSFAASSLANANLSSANLNSANLRTVNATGANFRDANLRSASFVNARLDGADFTGADIYAADFEPCCNVPSTIAVEQLQSTVTYEQGDFGNIKLGFANLTGLDFSGKAARASRWTGANLAGAQFDGGFLEYATFDAANMANANLTDGFFARATFRDTVLDRADLSFADLSSSSVNFRSIVGATFYNTNLANATIASGVATDAVVRYVDLRGAGGVGPVPDVFLNSPGAIRPNGSIAGLDIPADDVLLLRDHRLAVLVEDGFTIQEGGELRFQFDGDGWGSTIRFEPGIPVELGGELEFTFASGVDLHSQIGKSFLLFDWTGVSPTGAFAFHDAASWDIANLYALGTVTYLGAATPGDANGDRVVDLADLNLVRNNFGATGERPLGDTYPFDGVVDLSDLNAVRNHFGAGPTGSPVPEPSTIALMLLSVAGCSAIAFKRRVRA
jgi:uncharacterized protein YjbI with pentapeptide repeats